MKYNVMYRTYWKDGTFTEIIVNHEPIEKFGEAFNYANRLNNHLWKFHQDRAGESHHYVKEI